MKVENIPIAKINPGENTRGTIDKNELEELKSSIETSGLLQEIGIVENNSHYNLAYGRRRLEAFKLLGRTEIPAKVYPPGTDIEALKIIENLHREDITPLELAAAIKKYKKASKFTLQQIADILGKKLIEIAQANKLNDLISPLAKKLQEGKLELDAAYFVARYPDVEQKEFFEKSGRYTWGERITIKSAKDFFSGRGVLLKNFLWPLDKEFPHLPKCTECNDRSSLQELLFSEHKEDDTCLNQKCLTGKVTANLKEIIKASEKEGEVIFIRDCRMFNSNFKFVGEGVEIYEKESLKRAGKNSKNAKTGIIVQSERLTNIGKSALYEKKPRAKSSSSSDRKLMSELPPEEQLERRLENYNKKKGLILYPMSVEVGQEIQNQLSAIDYKKYKNIPSEVLEVIADYVSDTCGYEMREALRKIWSPSKKDKNSIDKIMQMLVFAATFKDLEHFNMSNAEYFSRSNEYIRMRNMAPALGVDIKAIEQKIKPKYDELLSSHKERFISKNKIDPEAPKKKAISKPVKKAARAK